MDKKKVISAYRRGFISMQECKQILGINNMQLLDMLAAEDTYIHPHPVLNLYNDDQLLTNLQ